MNGDEMNTANILMNFTAPAPVGPGATNAAAAPGAAQLPGGFGSFDQALSAASDPAPASLEMIADLLLHAGVADCGEVTAADEADSIDPETDTVTDASQCGVAAILAQMLAGSTPPPRAQSPLKDSEMTSIAPQVLAASAQIAVAAPVEAGSSDPDSGPEGEEPGNKAIKDVALEPQRSDATVREGMAAAGDSSVLERLSALPAQATQPAQIPQGDTAAQGAIQTATHAIRDTAAVSTVTTPVHPGLREPVGTTGWADELGNRLVMMSVRGQQQGSLTLTPEHLGPMEVQISVNKDTANVWFGAQHADTRAALVDAMPRLRELLASNGLSLGQSGVSEQAPRQSFAAMPSQAGGGSRLPDIDAVEAPVAWRQWRPGLVDTYA
jgi:flagellar hook-length control protein FliK